MNVKRNLRIYGLLAVLATALIHYQNCAPVNSVSHINDQVNSDRVGIIDNFDKTTQIKFVAAEVLVPATASDVQVDGLCSASQDGAVLAWRVINENNEVISSGNSTCDLSGFRVYLSQVNQLPCGKSHALKAQFGFDKGDQVLIVRDCQN